MTNLKKLLAIFFIPLLFLIIALVTLKDYGVGFDEPLHFHRGQAYLHYYLTGEKQFPKIDPHRDSYYESPSLSADFWLSTDGGHPILNDVLASLTNHIFYQKLRVLGDIESYQLFNILTATISVIVVCVFAYKTYGILVSLVAGLTIALFPLFFAESHFNVKDPAQSAFFTLTIFAFWMSLKRANWRWLLLAIFSTGVALSMKWNIIFLPAIIVPYLIVRYWTVIKNDPRKVIVVINKLPKSYKFLLLFSPIIVFSIFFASWPFLWQDPIGNFWEIIKWHKMLGTGYTHDGMFVFGHFNIYAPYWIYATTPPWILFLTTVGLIFALKNGWKGDKTPILWVLWFVLPIVRVSLPNTVIYGGIRQIMEFIPVMALLSGLGAYAIYNWLTSVNKKNPSFKKLIYPLIILAFLPHIFVMTKLHPNENVYVNSLVGGLASVSKANIPYWGNSFGNAYWQMMQWLNNNTEPNSKVALVQGTGLNIPKIKLRSDIAYSNAYWSGINREGEYLMELTHQDSVRLYPYAWEYVEKLLEPVYEVKVDGVTIAKIWKNDIEHTNSQFKKINVKYSEPFQQIITDKSLVITLRENILLTSFIIPKTSNTNCKISGNFFTSLDGVNWQEEAEHLPTTTQLGMTTDDLVKFYFAAREVKYIKLELDSPDLCLLQNPKVELMFLR